MYGKISLTRVARLHNKEGSDSSTNGAGQTEYPHAKI